MQSVEYQTSYQETNSSTPGQEPLQSNLGHLCASVGKQYNLVRAKAPGYLTFPITLLSLLKRWSEWNYCKDAAGALHTVTMINVSGDTDVKMNIQTADSTLQSLKVHLYKNVFSSYKLLVKCQYVENNSSTSNKLSRTVADISIFWIYSERRTLADSQPTFTNYSYM